MIQFISFFAAFSLFFMLLALAAFMEREKVDVIDRLKKISVRSDDAVVDIRDAELQRPLRDRLIRPMLDKITKFLNRMMPTSILVNLQPKLNRAGNPGGLTAGEYLTVKILCMTVGALAGIPFLLNLDFFRMVLFIAGGMLAVWVIPDFYLKNLAQQRSKEIEKSMPDILDLLTVSVEAGYGWDAALLKVTEKRKGPLAREFQRVAQEVTMGKPRRDAMRDLAQRVNIDCVTTFVTAVVQADQLGLSLGQVLRSQSDKIRHKRKQEVEEEAMKAPIKMLIPMVVFIFPVVFIVLLGPALLQIIRVL